MLTISRIDGSVEGKFTQEESDRLWEAIARKIAPKVVSELEKQKKEVN